MENERFSKVLSNCHLPEELCREILLRLPVKSLLRFCCVSKSWLSLISDPKFCRVHLKNFKNNRDETHLLAVQGGQLDCVVRCSDTFKASAGTLVTVPPRFRGRNWRVECSVDGLVLLKGPGRNDLVVWNPSIRKFHDIPPSPVDETPHLYHVSLGLGYDPLVKDYKLVRLIFAKGLMHLVEVYTLVDSSWKIIEYQGKESSNRDWGLYPISKAIYVRGFFYFIHTNKSSCVLELAYFDLSREAFGSIGLPPDLSSPYVMGKLPLFGYGTSSLALFDLKVSPSHPRCTILWAVLESLDTESKSFTSARSCSPKVYVDCVLFLKKNLDMLLWRSDEELSFCLATDKSMIRPCCYVTSYNPETREEKMLVLEINENGKIPDVYGYIESLVLLN